MDKTETKWNMSQGNVPDMMTHNLRFALTVIAITLAFGCLGSGISWLGPLALPLLIISHWPKSRMLMAQRLTLVGVIGCLVAAIIAFVDASYHGTVFIRKPEPHWKLIIYAIAWGMMIFFPISSWWLARSPSQVRPEGGD